MIGFRRKGEAENHALSCIIIYPQRWRWPMEDLIRIEPNAVEEVIGHFCEKEKSDL